MFLSVKCFIVLAVVIDLCYARKHTLHVVNDDRRYIALSKFGFYKGGILDVKLDNFMLPADAEGGIYGFTLDRTESDSMSPYMETHTDMCLLESPIKDISSQHPGIFYFKMNLVNLRLDVECGGNIGNIGNIHLYTNRSQIPIERLKRQSFLLVHRRKRNIVNDIESPCSKMSFPITKETRNGFSFYNTSFAMYVATIAEEGFYNFYFHNCLSYKPTPPLNFVIEIYESNRGNFLSAGDLPLPALYTMMSLLFALSACFWCFILRTSRYTVYKIHIIMCVLVFLKSLSLALHGVNYHFIQTKGEHVPAWAILYYITHLLKGAVLFVTIVLVGTGWNFIKHILADRDKKLFMIVIPLQVLANVTEIIIEESEEGAVEHNTWRYILTLIDLLCCGAILFPVVWSIRHLQDASFTDGKALISLRKLKLFRHFYIMVVCYIYSTRIIAILLKKIVPFQYSWLDEMFKEMATFVFFVLTGYKFRPASANPYFTETQMEDMESEVITESPVYEGLTKLSKRNDFSKEDQQPLIQESSHDYD